MLVSYGRVLNFYFGSFGMARGLESKARGDFTVATGYFNLTFIRLQLDSLLVCHFARFSSIIYRNELLVAL